MGEFYKEYPKLCAPDDYWGQVKRTINGVPVGQDQIDLILRAIVDGLDLQASDSLLDLCCGNGALSRLLFDRCAGQIYLFAYAPYGRALSASTLSLASIRRLWAD